MGHKDVPHVKKDRFRVTKVTDPVAQDPLDGRRKHSRRFPESMDVVCPGPPSMPLLLKYRQRARATSFRSIEELGRIKETEPHAPHIDSQAVQSTQTHRQYHHLKVVLDHSLADKCGGRLRRLCIA